jgi:tetratricopeptide (TPR) repeat protein
VAPEAGRRPSAGSGKGSATGHAGAPEGEGGRARADDLLRAELADEVGARKAPQIEARLGAAARAFQRGRYPEARTELRKLSREVPGSASVRELLGLTYYRLGQWKAATQELTKFVELTGSEEQHPVLADCQRALGRHADVERLWAELREGSPSGGLVAEGRIVMAGSLADRGRLRDAVKLLEQARWQVKRPREHHLRIAYALADLQERAGDLPAARATFAWIVAHDAEFADAGERLAGLT